MLTQQNIAPQAQNTRTIKSRNPIFTGGHVTKRTRSKSPRKNVRLIQSSVGKAASQSASRKLGLTLLEIGKQKPVEKVPSRSSKLQLLDKKYVKKHVQSQRKEPKLEKFLQVSKTRQVSPRAPKTSKGPSDLVVRQLEKENIPEEPIQQVQIQPTQKQVQPTLEPRVQPPTQKPKPILLSSNEIEKKWRAEVERLETKINQMSIDEIRRRAKESVSLIDDEVFEQKSPIKEKPTVTPLIQPEADKSRSLRSPTPEPINHVSHHVPTKPAFDSLDAEIEKETKIENQLDQLNLEELNSLHDDIGESHKMGNNLEMPNFTQQKPRSLYDKALDSARRREGNLKHNR